MKCHKCNGPLDKHDKFCTKCGLKINHMFFVPEQKKTIKRIFNFLGFEWEITKKEDIEPEIKMKVSKYSIFLTYLMIALKTICLFSITSFLLNIFAAYISNPFLIAGILSFIYFIIILILRSMIFHKYIKKINLISIIFYVLLGLIMLILTFTTTVYNSTIHTPRLAGNIIIITPFLIFIIFEYYKIKHKEKCEEEK